MKPEQKFFEAIETIAFDKVHRERISSSLLANRAQVKQAKLFYSDIELARTRAAFIKSKTLDNLDKYLIEFESNFAKKGGKVIWAKDNEEALSEIYKLIEKKAAKKILKSRSPLFEEIELNSALQNKNMEVNECDFGNYIQTQAGENAYHPVFPTLNQTKDSTIEILRKKHDVSYESSTQELSDLINDTIKAELSSSSIAITGASFLIADSGSVVVFENEACVANLSALPKTQIVIAGIEEIIPSLNDLDLFLHLYSTYSTGTAANTYTHLISGPKQNEEIDGPDEMFVVLLDNGRSDVLAQINQRSALACIKCGACYAVCPVYKNIGGHSYQAVYNGPIGSILTPLLKGMEEYKFLSFASPSSMECAEECPVKIDFPKLLQHNRTDSIKICPPGKTEKLALFFWKAAMLKRNNMDKGGAKLKNFMLRQFFKKSWGDRREIPSVAAKSFNQIWKERKGIK
jgi:L-lactate dehydrogenase complex protein LldF